MALPDSPSILRNPTGFYSNENSGSENSGQLASRHIVKKGVEWTGLDWSGFVKGGFVKHGFVKGGFVKHDNFKLKRATRKVRIFFSRRSNRKPCREQ